MSTTVFGPAYNGDNRRQSVFSENIAGVGSHGNHLPKPLPAPDRVHHGATSSTPIHLRLPLSPADVPVPLPPYIEQQKPPRLVVRNESPLSNNYVGSSVSPDQAAGRSGRPHIPRKPEALLWEEEFEDPFSDPQYEAPPGLRM